jgi:hypothetical protein
MGTTLLFRIPDRSPQKVVHRAMDMYVRDVF